MRYFEFIVEGMQDRIALLAKQQGPKIVTAAVADRTLPNVQRDVDPVEILNQLAEADPTDGKMLTFIVRSYANGEFVMEDIPGIKNLMTRFIASRAKLKAAGQPVDIMQYKTRSDLIDAVRSVESAADVKSEKQKAAEIKEEGADTMFQGPGIVIKHLKTEEAACFYGKGTEWCTAATKSDNRFEDHNKQGDLYAIILTKENRKFQFHYETDQFMNENDAPVSKSEIALLSKYPAYKDFLNFQIKKHYGKYFEDSDSASVNESRVVRKKKVTRRTYA